MAAGTLSLIANTKTVGHFPKDGLKIVIATVVLVMVASATGGSKVAPLVHAIGLLLLMGAGYQMMRVYNFPAPKKA